MTALIIIGIILFLLLLLALMRVGVIAEYGADGALVKVRAGLVSVTIVPSKPKKKEKKPKKQKKEKPQEQAAPSESKGKLEGFKQLLPSILKAGGRFKRKLRIDRLYIHFTTAGLDDPAKAAINYGRGNMAIGIIVPVLENNFDIRKRDLVCDVDFTAEKSEIYVLAELTLAVWSLVYIAAGFLFPLLKARSAGKSAAANDKKEKAVQS